MQTGAKTKHQRQSRCPSKISRHRRKSPIAWVGGKSRLADRIVQRLPQHTCYVEPFAGAAWVLFRKEASKVEVINDINKDLITLYRCIKHHPEALIAELNLHITSRAEFDRLRTIDADTLTDIQRAARFYYIVKTSFGSKFAGATFGTAKNTKPRFNPDPAFLIDSFSQVAQRLARCYIECQPYYQVIKRYDSADTCFYIDPPYWDCENDYGKGVFGKDDFTRLATLLGDIKGKFILSLNDRPQVRDIFAAFHFEQVSTTYTLSTSNNQKVGEVLITNF